MRRAIAARSPLAIALLIWVQRVGAGITPVGASDLLRDDDGGAKPTAIVDGYDGNVWFLETGDGAVRIGTVTPAGRSPSRAPASIAADGDRATASPGTSSANAVWVAIAERRPQLRSTAYGPLGTAARTRSGSSRAARPASPPTRRATCGSPMASRNAVYEVKPPVHGRRRRVPAAGGRRPTSIAAGPDGTTMWVTEPARERDRVDQRSGNVHAVPAPDRPHGHARPHRPRTRTATSGPGLERHDLLRPADHARPARSRRSRCRPGRRPTPACSASGPTATCGWRAAARSTSVTHRRHLHELPGDPARRPTRSAGSQPTRAAPTRCGSPTRPHRDLPGRRSSRRRHRRHRRHRHRHRRRRHRRR